MTSTMPSQRRQSSSDPAQCEGFRARATPRPRVGALSVGIALVLGGGWFACDRSGNGGESPTDGTAGLSGSGGATRSATDGSGDSTGAAGGGGNSGGSGGGAGTASLEIPTNTLTAADVPPIPPYWELLYVVGTDTPGTVRTFLVDGETLYWVQQNLIWRAPKDGNGVPLAFGHYESTNQGSRLLMDEEYVYWHDGAVIKRKRKDSSAESPSNAAFNFNFPEGTAFDEETENIEFGGDYPIAYFDVKASRAYVGHPSCTPLHVVDLGTLDVEIIEFERPEFRGGSGDMRVDSETIFCANSHWLFKIATDGWESQ